jgi:hyperosmotically inducible periplasmic protein
MANNRQPPGRSKLKAPFPAQRRRTVRAPGRQRQWITGTVIDAAIVIFSTLATTMLLLLISNQVQDTTAGDLISRSAAPMQAIPASPTPQPSMAAHESPGIQPTRAPATPSPTAVATPQAAGTPDDEAIQAAIERKLRDDPKLSALGITATVTNGKVTLEGTAPSDEMKDQAERLVRTVKGVKQVDNQIVVISDDMNYWEALT